MPTSENSRKAKDSQLKTKDAEIANVAEPNKFNVGIKTRLIYK